MRNFRFLQKPHYSNSRALIVGIDAYKSAAPLSYAVSDAREIRDLLINALEFPASNVTYLTDSDATRVSILKAYLRFTRIDVGLDDRIFVFYAGHGHTLSGNQGEIGYLVPHDGDADVPSTMIRWDGLTNDSELIRAKHILFVMDACYGGLALTRGVYPGSTRFLKEMLLRHSRQVLTAGKADEVVADAGGPLPNHSVFTGHLIEGLRGKADSAEGVLTANGLMAYVYGKVATDRNSHQTPHYGYFDGDGDFIFRPASLGAMEQVEDKDLDQLISVPFSDEPTQGKGTAEKVAHVKELLSSDAASIELHDFLMGEVRKLLSSTAADSFPDNEPASIDAFQSHLTRYEEAATDLALLLACIAYWGKVVHGPLLSKVLARSTDRLVEHQSGLTVWAALRWYPLLLAVYSAGIAAVDAQRFDSLNTILHAPLAAPTDGRAPMLAIDAVTSGIVDLHRSNFFKNLPGYERRHTPLSDYLFKLLQPKLDDALFLGKSYAADFDTFEVIFSLVIADRRKETRGDVWAPAGRFAACLTQVVNWPFCLRLSRNRFFWSKRSQMSAALVSPFG